MTNIEKLQPVNAAPSGVMTPMAMIDRAIAGGASIETLERLMALQERYEAAQARREFDEAISAAKAEIKPIIKTKTVAFPSKSGGANTNYAYEGLAEIGQIVDPILSKYGLSYRYKASQEGTRLTITCVLSHRLGHREETTLQATDDNTGNKNSIQAVGSAATYLQRYTLKLALGLAAAVDTDGNVSDEPVKLIDDAQFRYLQDLVEKAGADEKKLLAYLKAETLEGLTQVQYRSAESALRKKIAQSKVEVKQ